MTTKRYRRSSVRAVLETMTRDHAAAAEAHDALWAVLWSRRYDDVDEPVWGDTSYGGILAFSRVFDEHTTLLGMDTGDAFVVFRSAGPPPPTGCRLRVLPSSEGQWRFVEIQPLGLGIEVRFDDPGAPADTAWIGTLRSGTARLRALLDARRDQLSSRRNQLGALNEPPTVEDIWREELAAISDRVAVETDYTAHEHADLLRAKTKGARFADQEEHRLIAARKRRFTEHGNAEVARFREERWPAIRDRAAAEWEKYAAYRADVLKLEDALQRIRGLTERTVKAPALLDALERAAFPVRGLSFDAARLEEAGYAEELLRTIELLHAAIPLRATSTATSFSAYRAPTAGPSVTPPRL
ncbi:MAG TPA: hypothetical protein VGU66_21480 [Candidatus Elarobacter sp.]|nr:hypothetical protein [Candidatus Elarobacter sp.]